MQLRKHRWELPGDETTDSFKQSPPSAPHIHAQDLNADFVKFVELVEATVDMDMVGHHEFVIKPSFDEELTSE